MLSINTNLSSFIAQNSLKNSTSILNQAVERMTTGYKINHAKDNAANYSISTNMTTKINSYMVAEDNAASALDMISTAEGTLDQIEDKLVRLRALQEQATNGTYGEQSLNAINAEVNALVDEIDRLYSTAEYNGIKVFSNDDGLNVATPAMSTFSARATTSASKGFIQQINRRNTAPMTEFSTVDENVELADGQYSISTADDLMKLATMTNAGLISSGDEFVLANDISLSGKVWVAIGEGNSFKGKFDGNGFVISDLEVGYYTIDCAGGFFGTIEGGEVRNLGLVYPNYGTESSSGGVADIIKNSTISNCYVEESFVASVVGGGLVYLAQNSTIEYCYVKEPFFSAADEAGGLVCYFDGGVLKDSYVEGGGQNFNGISPNPGGGKLIYDATGVTVSNCYSTFQIIEHSNSVNSVDRAYDWDGTEFTLVQAVGESYVPITGGDTNTTPDAGGSSADDESGTIFLQIGLASNWASRLAVNTKFALNNVDSLRMIGLDLTTDYLTEIDDMLAVVSEKQTHLGATSNRLESVLDEIVIQRDNLISSRSTIRDADIAEVSSHYIQQQILQQASSTLLATANQSPSIALQLI